MRCERWVEICRFGAVKGDEDDGPTEGVCAVAEKRIWIQRGGEVVRCGGKEEVVQDEEEKRAREEER